MDLTGLNDLKDLMEAVSVRYREGTLHELTAVERETLLGRARSYQPPSGLPWRRRGCEAWGDHAIRRSTVRWLQNLFSLADARANGGGTS